MTPDCARSDQGRFCRRRQRFPLEKHAGGIVPGEAEKDAIVLKKSMPYEFCSLRRSCFLA